MAASNNETVAELLTRLIDHGVATGQFSQVQITKELEYPKPNIITMFKQGKTRLPLNKVGAMAKVLKIDRVFLFKKVMSEYHPDTYESLADLLDTLLLTDNEVNIVRNIRSMSGGVDPELTTDEERQQLSTLVAGMVARHEENVAQQEIDIANERARKAARTEETRRRAQEQADVLAKQGAKLG